MPWMSNPLSKPKALEPQEAPFQADVTLEEYYQLPWTVELVPVQSGASEWHCLELDIKHHNAETFDLLCRDELKEELAAASKGFTPKLPTGMRWKDGRPARDPGPARDRGTSKPIS